MSSPGVVVKGEDARLIVKSVRMIRGGSQLSRVAGTLTLISLAEKYGMDISVLKQSLNLS